MASDDLYVFDDPRFRTLTVPQAAMEKLHGGCRWTEGPVWFADLGCLIFSDIPNRRLLRWTAEGGVSVFRADSNFTNGNTRDRQGRLISCEHGGRRVVRTEPDGTMTVIADSYEGRRLNSPNDVVVAADGGIWFSDPTYGILSNYEGYKAEPEQPTRNVYRVDPATGAIAAVVTDFLQPNGLAFSPDETILYVADSGGSHDPDAARHIRAFDVVDGTRLANGRVFCNVGAGVPDGLRVDTDGNVWTSAGDGVHCFAPDGTLLGRILVPGPVANLTFGGAARNRLFITANEGLYSLFVAASGAQRP